MPELHVSHRRRRAARLAVSLIVTFSVFAFADGPAHACSCASGDPRDALRASDAAFVGALRAKDDHGDGTALYTFVVEASVKGDLGESVRVESASSGSACGFEVRMGRRTGIMLDRRRGGGWSGGLCSQIDPDVLIAAAEPLPAPNGVGPIRLIVGGNFGEARLLALDRVGRTLAYGYGAGATLDISMCPGMARFAEVAQTDTTVLVVRDTSTLDVVRKVRVVGPRRSGVRDVSCLTDDGELLAAVERGRGASVHVVRGRRDRVVFTAEHVAPWFQGNRTYVRSGNAVARLGLWTGALEPLAEVPSKLGAVEVSPDERHVGGVLYGGSRRGEPPTEVVAVRSSDGSARSFALEGWNDSGAVHWVDDGRLLYLPGGGDDDRAHLLALPGLTRVGGFRGWYTGTSLVTGGCARGVGWGTVFRACLPDGPVRTRDLLLGPETFAAASVTGRVLPARTSSR